MGSYIEKLEATKVEDDNEAKMLEGRDIAVVIRARPLLQHELDQGHIDVTHAQNPDFHFFENKMNFKG
jgi:hypothetical protein